MKWKERLAWAIVGFWAIAFVVGILGLIIYSLITATYTTFIAMAIIALFFLTVWAFIYIEENDL